MCDSPQEALPGELGERKECGEEHEGSREREAPGPSAAPSSLLMRRTRPMPWRLHSPLLASPLRMPCVLASAGV